MRDRNSWFNRDLAHDEALGVDRMLDILRGLGVGLEVTGCGCCGSPGVTFEYHGERIVDTMDDLNFSTLEDG